MTAAALQACLARHQAHAAATFRLDDELGTQHGIAWEDFVLLELLDAAGGEVPARELARRLGRTPSHFLLQLLPLEKVGLVSRTTGEDGQRAVTLRKPGRGLLNEARDTAAAVCGAMAPA